jgi:hypothetical protein
MSLKEASMKVFRSTRVLALCAGSAIALALGGGVASASPDSMEYVGYSPCSQPVKAVVPVTCDAETGLVHWRLQLHRNPSSHAPTSYDLWVEYGETANGTNGIARGLKTIKREGKWSMTGSGPKATIKLDGLMSFTHVGVNLIHPLNPDGSLMTGNGGWSFTLNNFNKLEKPADRSKAASLPEVSYQLTPLAGGPTVHGVFEGRTPCQGISRDLKIEAHPACEKLKWRVTLYQEAGADKPTTYKAEGTLFQTKMREGRWSSASGSMGTTYKLEGAGGAPAIQLLRGDDDVLFFLGQDGAPLVGSTDFSYTLNRRGAAPAG